MTTKFGIIASISAALMLGVASLPAQALDISVGGTSVSGGSSGNGGTSVSVGGGGTSTGATVGGGTNVASVGASTGGTNVGVGIGTTNGDLIATNTSDGNVQGNVNLGGLGAANGTVNGVTGPIGDLLDGVDLGSLPGGGLPGGGGAINSGGLGGAYATLSPSDQRALKIKCRSVLSSPASFNANTVALCRLIASL